MDQLLRQVGTVCRDISYLKGKLNERRDITKAITSQIAGMQKEIITGTSQAISQVMQTLTISTPVATSAPVQSYASVTGRHHKQPNKNVILAYPKEGGPATSAELEKVIKTNINPKEDGIRVIRMSSVRNGGFAVEVQASLGKVLMGKCSHVRNPKKTPRIIIYDIPRDYDQEQLKVDIYQQNLKDLGIEDEIFRDSFQLLFKTGPWNDESCHWVCSVKPPLFSTFVGNRRIYLGWLSYKLKEYIAVTRCYRCQKYGHLSKDCQALEEVCGHCAGLGHDYSGCADRDKPAVCVNCQKGRMLHNHDINSTKCESYLAEKKRQIQQTDYE